MFLLLLFATSVVALLVAFAVMHAFTKPIDSVLKRIIAERSTGDHSRF